MSRDVNLLHVEMAFIHDKNACARAQREETQVLTISRTVNRDWVHQGMKGIPLIEFEYKFKVDGNTVLTLDGEEFTRMAELFKNGAW